MSRQRPNTTSQDLTDEETDARDSSGSVYHPKQKRSKGIDTTPSSRALEDSQTPEAAKRRVDRATVKLTGTRCLLENTSQVNEVQYAHCFRRSTSSHILYNLEHSWGMDPGTLNLDTRFNIFRLSVKFHRLFDRGLWILVPDEKIITVYYDALPKQQENTSVLSRPNQKLPSIPKALGPPYKYTVLAHPQMQSVPLFRQKENTTGKGALTADDFDFLPHPYSESTITSHVHPRFIICSIAWAMNQADKVSFNEQLSAGYLETPRLVDVLGKAVLIYEAWSTSIGSEVMNFAAGGSGANSGFDNNSKTTPPFHALRSKRARAESPTEGLTVSGRPGQQI